MAGEILLSPTTAAQEQQKMVDRANWLGLATVIFSNLSASERKFATAQCAADALVQSAIFWKVVEESEKQASVVAP